MFVFSTCQVGAESVFKREVAQTFPGMRSAFSRPGFVTFKSESLPLEDFGSVFARTTATSLGKIETDSGHRLETDAWRIAHHLFVNRVHVYQREPTLAGEHGFEPHIPTDLLELHRQIVGHAPKRKFLGTGAEDIFHPAQPDETVLDVVKVEPNLFMVGTHTVTHVSPIHAKYPGGILPVSLPEDAVSRAYLKFHEGILWSGIVMKKGDKCLDIGASPGGCSQFLLQQGVNVFGVDPGAIHPVVQSHPRFTHIRSRIKDTKRSLFQNVRWIVADMNVAPNYTLDVLEEVIAKTEGSVRGLLFTLKLIRWELADKLPMLLDRIRTWGFTHVRMKQLVFNRQEVMVAALEPSF
jgi:23S rRNA (cytidine2498-2'-O)-methyltransferase